MGVLGLIYHSSGFFEERPFDLDWALVTLIRVLAIVAGAFTLRGRNWARWLLSAWIAFHVGIGYLHSWQQFIVHGLLFLVIVYFLFRRRSAACFRGKAQEPGGVD